MKAFAAAILVSVVALAASQSNALAGAAYRVAGEELHSGRATLSVVLDERPVERDLKQLVVSLQAQRSPSKAPLAAIAFHIAAAGRPLPVWAEATFEPELRVSILGLRRDEVEFFRAEASVDGRDVVGVWVTSPPALPGKLTIWRAPSRQLFAEWHLRSGQKTADEVFEGRNNRGRHYQVAGANGEYYLALWNGALELGDRSAVLAVAERLSYERAPVRASPAVGQTAVSPPVVAPANAFAEAPVVKPRKFRRRAARTVSRAARQKSVHDTIAASLRNF